MESNVIYNITSAKYYDLDGIDNSQIKVQLDSSSLWTFFPNVAGNDLYDAVLAWVAEGNTIADAD